ncbi:TlpA family protein disulfide reductase, partial [bacterium]|nr:TlpA family protein disulfide reductase [bacterium]
LNGESFTLSSLKGKVIILDFWATWCPPCIKGVPDFMDLQERYKNQGLEVGGVLLDQGKKSSLESKVKKMGINYTVVFGDREVTQLYGGVRAIPTTFIIDQKGNKIEKYVGYNSKETFENKIKELFAQ